MSYPFVVFRYPRPELRAQLLFRMHQMAELMATEPRFIDARRWAEEDNDCIAGTSMWESGEAYLAALEKAGSSGVPFQYERAPGAAASATVQLRAGAEFHRPFLARAHYLRHVLYVRRGLSEGRSGIRLWPLPRRPKHLRS